MLLIIISILLIDLHTYLIEFFVYLTSIVTTNLYHSAELDVRRLLMCRLSKSSFNHSNFFSIEIRLDFYNICCFVNLQC